MAISPTHEHSVHVASLSNSTPKGIVYVAALTLALSLPQGMLALPIAVAQVGLVPGLLIMLMVGALNIAAAAWTAQHVTVYFARYGIIPSLMQLAHDRLGKWGQLLTLASGTALFFLALLASIVGLARSLENLTGTPAPIWGASCGLIILAFLFSKATISSRLVIGLGMLNVCLIMILLLLMLPHAQPMATPTITGGSPLSMVGVSLMLFFAPILVAQVGQRVLPCGGNPQAFVRGTAAGVSAGIVLFLVWAVAVCHVAGIPSPAASSGTTIAVLVMAMPEANLPAMLLEFLLLGMTALRCTLVLGTLAEEQLLSLNGRHRYLAILPAGIGLLVSFVLLLTGTTSFIQLIAIAGGGAASITSLAIPTLLTYAKLVSNRRI